MACFPSACGLSASEKGTQSLEFHVTGASVVMGPICGNTTEQQGLMYAHTTIEGRGLFLNRIAPCNIYFYCIVFLFYTLFIFVLHFCFFCDTFKIHLFSFSAEGVTLGHTVWHAIKLAVQWTVKCEVLFNVRFNLSGSTLLPRCAGNFSITLACVLVVETKPFDQNIFNIHNFLYMCRWRLSRK